jgi:hypothetical protein
MGSISPIRDTCPVHLIFLDLIIPTELGEGYKLPDINAFLVHTAYDLGRKSQSQGSEHHNPIVVPLSERQTVTHSLACLNFSKMWEAYTSRNMLTYVLDECVRANK